MRALLLTLALCLWSFAAAAKPIRVLVAAGQARGLAEQGTLKHANRDAERFRKVFVKQGRVDAKHAILVKNATRSSLFSALLRAKAAAASQPKSQVTFIFYFSGHGDRTHLNLAGDAVPLAELRRAIGQVPAGLRLVVVDACRSTDPARKKGVSATAPFSIAVDAPAASGSVWLYAAADGEAAQESDALAGAVFTHFLVNGLKGAADANRDRRVTLSEAWSFAYNQTLYRSARGSGVMQRPAAQYDLAESAPLVLTFEDRRAAELTFPAARDTHYLVYATGSKTVAAELWATPKETVAVSLPPGQYIVQRRGAAGAAAIQLSLANREKRTLQASDFRPVALEELAAKGGTLVMRPHEAFVSAGATTGTLDAVMPRIGFGAGTRIGELALSLRLGGARGEHVSGDNDVTVTTLDSSVELAYVLPLAPVELRFGAGPTALVVWEGLRRRDADLVGPLGYPVEQNHRALALGGVASASGRVRLSEALFAELGVRGGVLGVQRQSSTSALWLATAEAGAGVMF